MEIDTGHVLSDDGSWGSGGFVAADLGGHVTGTVETSNDPVPVGDEAFRGVMRFLAGGVVMVTTRVNGRAWGLTVSACTSLSAEPPQLLVSVREHTVTGGTIARDGLFGVSILSAAHRDVARLGSAPGQPKFVDAVSFQPPADSTPYRMPRVAGALCHLDCAVADTHRVGDHLLIVGLVTHTFECATHAEKGPLVYYDRAYRRIGEGDD